MILLLGASGYVGQAFARELDLRGRPFTGLSRRDLDYTRFPALLELLRQTKPEFLINTAGCAGKPNIDACENAKAETLLGNTLLPQLIGAACAATDTPWGHVSSGCIFSGAKILKNNGQRIEPDLTRPELRELLVHSPEKIQGYTEEDEPNFSFRHPPCSFYSGTKALGEDAIAGMGRVYTWRLRLPFDEFDDARNLLSKVQRYPKVYDNANSISHRGDFVKACLDLWETGAPFGTYNLTNPGFITTRQIVEAIQKILRPGRNFEFWIEEEFQQFGVKSPRSNCILDSSKLLAAGVKMRPVAEAIDDALTRWHPENR